MSVQSVLVPAQLLPGGKSSLGEVLRGEYSLGQEARSSEFALNASIANLLARPKRVRLGVVNDSRLRLKHSIRVELAFNEGTCVASWPDIDEFGYGSNMSAALDDLGKTLAELYFRLHESDVSMSGDLARVRDKLDDFLEPRPRK